MRTTALSSSSDQRSPSTAEYRLWRQSLEDGETTTVYALLLPLRATRVRTVFFARPRRLDVWWGGRGRGGGGRRVLRPRPVPAARRGLERRPRGRARAL